MAKCQGDGPLEDPTVRQTSFVLRTWKILISQQIKSIATLRGKTPAQVILAWLTGRGIAVVPKSAVTSRIESNYDMMFPLSAVENEQISSLMGSHGELGVRRLANEEHIGFDVFDEEADQPVEMDSTPGL